MPASDVAGYPAEVRRVSTAGDRWAVVVVTARAYSRQLLTRPWGSVLGLPLLLGWIAVVILVLPLEGLPAVSAAELGVFAAIVVSAYIVAALVVAGATAAALGVTLTVHPAPGNRTAYLLTHPAGRACVVVHDTDTEVWAAKALAAAPPRRGLGTELGRIVISDANAVGAALELWCTRSLEQLYAGQGFVTVRPRIGMRLMRRPADAGTADREEF